MRLITNIDRDIKATKAELIRLETKLERLTEERDDVIKALMEGDE